MASGNYCASALERVGRSPRCVVCVARCVVRVGRSSVARVGRATRFVFVHFSTDAFQFLSPSRRRAERETLVEKRNLPAGRRGSLTSSIGDPATPTSFAPLPGYTSPSHRDGFSGESGCLPRCILLASSLYLGLFWVLGKNISGFNLFVSSFATFWAFSNSASGDSIISGS